MTRQLRKRDVRRVRVVRVPDITRNDWQAITRALERPDVRAFAIIVGTLDPLSERARARVISFVADSLRERDEARA